MELRSIDHVQVAGPPGCEAAARTFYGDLLGLREIPKPPRLASRGGVWFRLGTQELHVGIEQDFRPALKAHPAFNCVDPDALAQALELAHFRAAVVMSHHLASDLAYLSALAQTTIPYVGLLGPAVRREKLLSDLGAAAHRLRPRLHAPVGLALGGRTPESIALAIVAELHAFVHGCATTAGTAVAVK